MRPLIFLVCALATTAIADPTNNPAPAKEEPLKADVARLAKQARLELRSPKANEVSAGKLTLSGVAVQAVKTGKPLQLINPAAPAKYGDPEDNLVRDPITSKPSGIKLFSILF